MHYCYSYDTSKYSTNLKSFVWGGSTQWSNPHNSTLLPVADPELQIRGGGEGGGSPKNFFQPFGPHFGWKIRGVGRALQAPALDPPLLLHTIFDKKGTPLSFIYMYIPLTNSIPFTYPVNKLCIPVKRGKYTVFEIWRNHKTKTFSWLFQSIKCICWPLWAFLQTKIMTDFPPLSYISIRKIPTLSYTRSLTKVPLSGGASCYRPL